MSKLTSLDAKFLHDLGDIYDAEHRFLDAQKEMRSNAEDRKLQQLIDRHMRQSLEQIERLEKAYELLGKPAKRVKCAAAAGLVSEGQKGMEDSEENPQVRDCVIAAASDKVEHYEISSYRGLIAQAGLMEQAELVAILQKNLDEEQRTAELIEESLPELLLKAKAAPAEKRDRTSGKKTSQADA